MSKLDLLRGLQGKVLLTNYFPIILRSTRLGTPDGTLLPRARTSMRVLRTPLLIKYERTDKARDSDSRRALLAERLPSPA